MTAPRKIKQAKTYSDRCTVCGKWFSEESARDLRAVVKAHKELRHPKQRTTSTGMKDRICTKCGKRFVGAHSGKCPSCFVNSKKKKTSGSSIFKRLKKGYKRYKL